MNLWIEDANRAVPLPETPAARIELLRRTVPLFPWIPLVPAALLLGTSLTAIVLAVRANRRAAALEEHHHAAHREHLEQPLETISP